MLFNSWAFLILLLVTVGLYYVPVSGRGKRVWQITLLLAASAVFYAWENPKLLILLGASCLLNAVAVERILFWKGEGARGLGTGDKWHRPAANDDPARAWLVAAVALNLGFLAFFKYAGFLANLFPDTLFPVSWKAWFSGIPLPIGISFYTFQGISLVVDAWRGDISPETRDHLSGRGSKRVSSVRDATFYISFFPQLVAGPIVKAHEFVDQIGAKRFRDIDWLTVRRALVTGYFLKIFVADNLAEQTGTLTLGAELLSDNGPLNLMPLLYGYSLQIFADFAGYSLIAIGLGALFGYRIPPNFNFPYLSTSITEFWRRWHLSLSSWLRDYLYFPLGGNRKGARRTYINLFLVMFLGGLWHGAAWKFALWGSLHGLALAVERLGGARRRELRVASEERLSRPSDSEGASHSRVSRLHAPRSSSRLPTPFSLLRTTLAWFCTFHLVTFFWLTFLMPDMASIGAFFAGTFSGRTMLQGPPAFSLVFYGSAVALYHAWGWLKERRGNLANRLLRSPLEPLVHGAMVFLVLTNPGAPRGFIYFQF